MAWDSKASGWDWDNEVLFQGQGTDFRKRLPANEWTSDSSELVLTGGGSGGPQNLCSNAPSGLGPSVVAATSSIGSEPSGLPGVVVANGIGAHTSNFSRVDHTSSRRLAMEDRSHSLGDVGGGGGGPFDCFGKDEANTNGSSRRTEKRAHDNAAAEERNVSFLELRSHASSRRVAEHVPADHHSNKGDCSLVSLGQEPGLQRSSLATVSSSEQHKRPPPPFLSVGGVDASQDVKKESTKGSTEEQQHSSTGATGSGGSGDSLNCLKLGKRTYFEDTTTTGSGGSKTAAAAAAATTTSSAATPAVTNSLPAAKKARAAAPGLQTPRCQVEGCKADLTSCKEYHRRHKVCEMHSKTARVIVAGQEQRFCQQCSRFHVLSEFDEGKRSCRRRLAGHNERRRKPQPDPLALNPRLPPNFQDDRRLGLFWAERSPFLHHSRMSGIPSVWEDSDDFRFPHGKGAWPRMVKLEDQSAYDCPMQGQGIERQLFLTGLSQQNNDRLPLLLLQSPKGMIPTANDVAGQRFHHYLQGSVGPIGQALSLSSSSGAGVLSGLEATPATEGLTRVSDSGRALSLLSSQPWCSRAPVAASLDLSTRSNMTLDQLINENQTPIAQPLLQGGQHQHFDFTTEKLLFMAPHSQSVLTSSGLPAGPMEKEPHVGSFIHGFSGFGHFDSHPMLCMQGHAQEGNSQDVKPTIDLMRMVSSSQSLSIQPHGPSEAFQIGSSHFGELQALRSYESSIFDSQHMM